MICRTCLQRSLRLRPSTVTIPLRCSFSSTTPTLEPSSATSTSAAQPFSTPLSPTPNEVSLGISQQPKSKPAGLPVSSAPAGAILKGLNYIKGRDDPVAKSEEEYPEWLWHILDAKKVTAEGEDGAGDEFSKSKKLRRKAAKRQRKLEAQLLASGNTDVFTPKVPLTQQSIDLPSNEEGTLKGALGSVDAREEVRRAMRRERRNGIKQGNYLKSM